MKVPRMFLVRCWMARGGKTSDRIVCIDVSKAPNNRMPDQWSKVPDRILTVTDRLKMVPKEWAASEQK
ncbi:hypothetical protein POF51_19465 [Brevibacillus sp. AG]|uniref:hypothetical protein n=1 Tax=Brevibacillus sp. AG TaxID=3020891 RepID=UPI0008535504|nr:hypothetical protein [Brevibacillus sp. AG]MDC0762899.1 hypothetical protein [Brevibacillus sp. AG]